MAAVVRFALTLQALSPATATQITIWQLTGEHVFL